MKTIAILFAILTITTNAVAEDDMVCKSTTTFETQEDGSTKIVTRKVCESK